MGEEANDELEQKEGSVDDEHDLDASALRPYPFRVVRHRESLEG